MPANYFCWILISYLLGSVPFGFIITRLSTGKNILEIGWKKTSGSNVFKNVGKWQGILTGLLDLLKGYLAVWGAKTMGFPSDIQIFSGVLAVVGHNWSVFLKFSGGRGIGTLVGAFWALSAKILAQALLPSLLLALIWNASVATILLLILSLFFSLSAGQFQVTGVFILWLLIPVFLKRLSPLKEVVPLKGKGQLIRNRLIFDNDEFCGELRIKKILKGLVQSRQKR